MAVDFAADLQQELDYFAGPNGMGVDGVYIDCTRTSSEWLLARCALCRCSGFGNAAGRTPASQSISAAIQSATPCLACCRRRV